MATGRKPTAALQSLSRSDQGRSGKVDPDDKAFIRTDNDLLEVIGRLVDQSMVVAEPGDGVNMRYRLLEPVRQYAFERLRELGEDGLIARLHRDWYVALAEAAWPGLIGPDQRTWLSRLEQEHDNLRSALEFSLQDRADAAPALRLAAGLHWFWWRRGHVIEGRTWLARTLELDARLETSPDLAAKRARMRALKGHLSRALGCWAYFAPGESYALAKGRRSLGYLLAARQPGL